MADIDKTTKENGFFMKDLLKLFKIFFKIGMFAFGGGYAILPLLKAELVEKRRLVREEELLDYFSIGQCTPGIIAINVATFIGYSQKGTKGAVAATLGMVVPPFILIVMIASVFQAFMNNQYVIYAFAGIKVCVVALIANVLVDLLKKNVRNIQSIFILCLALISVFVVGLSAASVVVVSALIALSIGEVKRKLKR